MTNDPTDQGAVQPDSPALRLVTGESIGDNARHLLARATLFQYVVSDDQTREIFRQWQIQTGIADTLLQARRAAEKIATTHGFPDRRRLIEAIYYPPSPAARIILNPARIQLRPIFATLDLTMEEARAHNYRLSEHVTAFLTQSAALPYPWLALEILLYFYRDIILNPLGLPNSLLITLELEDVARSEIPPELTGSTADVAALNEIANRIQQQGGDVNALLANSVPRPLTPALAELPRGKIPKKTRDVIQRYTEWLYRIRMKNESYRSVAKAWQRKVGGKDRRKDVYDGVTEVDQLLRLTPYYFDEEQQFPTGGK